LLNKQNPHNREHLASVFWGGYPTSIARKHLRDTLWRIRQTLHTAGAQPDKYLSIRDNYISFNWESSYWLDVEAFENAINSRMNFTGKELSAEQAAQLEETSKLYTGDLLEGVYEDWCLYDREHFRLLYINTLNKLMAYNTFKSKYIQALDYGERLLKLEPTQEDVHHRMMCLHLYQGERCAAITQYKQCYRILREVLGITPLAETKQLYEKILEGHSIAPIELQMLTEINTKQTEGGSPTLYTQKKSGSSIHPMVRQALQKLHKLQQIFDESRLELEKIEGLIHKATIK
jgi:DNA-binding SARP family transcriptional activator